MTGAGRGAAPSGCCSRAGASLPVSPAVIDLTAAGWSGASLELRSIFHPARRAMSGIARSSQGSAQREATRQEGRAECRRAAPRPRGTRQGCLGTHGGNKSLSSAQVFNLGNMVAQ